ncbi:MAG: DUF115 domain-containing protein [Succinivibrio sp.]|nr:DUF115 domain-containing protein [Succinivibrio sp.]
MTDKPGATLSQADLEEYQELSILQEQMRKMLLQRFSENMAAFSRYMPELARHFAAYKPSEALEFFCTHNGVPNLYFTDRKEVFYKVEDPLKLCEEQVRHYLDEHPFEQVKYRNEPDPYGQIHYRYVNACVTLTNSYPKEDRLTPRSVGSLPNCVMLGLGLGYQLDFLYSQVEIANLVIVEPNADLFYASLHAFNWAPLLKFLAENNSGIKLLVGVSEQELFANLYAFYDLHGRFLSGFCFNYVHYHSETISRLKEALKRDYSRNFQALGFFDDHLFALSHGARALEQQARLLRQDRILSDEYRDRPVFLVGSGPSLDKDLAFIRRHQDQALIFACGTALDCLYHAGIVPDFYCCTERTPEVAYSLELIYDPDFFDKVTLLATDVVHPRVLRLFKHQALFAKLDEPFYWMAVHAHEELKNWRPAIMINPLVGNMGLSGALHLGFRRLYLFGIDNGKKVGFTRMHSEQSKFYARPGSDSGGNYLLSTEVCGNFGGKVSTNKLYLLSIHMFEDLLSQFLPHVQCVNCSDGARLEGTRPKHAEELEQEFAALECIDKERFRHYLKEELTMSLPLSEKQLEQDLNKAEFAETVGRLEALLKKVPASRLGYVQLMQTISETISLLNQHAATKAFGYTLYGTLQSMFLMMMRALYHSQDEALCLKDARLMLSEVSYFLSDAKYLYARLPHYVLGEHLKVLDGKLGCDHKDSKAPACAPYREVPWVRREAGSTFVKRYS